MALASAKAGLAGGGLGSPGTEEVAEPFISLCFRHRVFRNKVSNYQNIISSVFERDSGSPLATGPARDPTQIIGQSIREIAQSLMGTRFGIVRTKRV